MRAQGLRDDARITGPDRSGGHSGSAAEGGSISSVPVISLVRTLLVLAFLISPSVIRCQAWSQPFRPPDVAGVQVQWRVYGVDTRTNRNVFEWVFSSVADTAVAFNYRIETDRGEVRIGRISVKPRGRQLSGWLFQGDSLVRIEVGRRGFGMNN
jgi:hypothetical protein